MQFKRKVVMEVFSDTMQIITIIVVIGAAFQTFAGADEVKPICPSLLTWECDNGECIHFVQRCNGKTDCSDGSDETVRECISFQCQPSAFRCAYGACVNQTAECNGIKNCADNSDELTAKCIPDIEERRQGNCTKSQFHCLSGECIPLDSLCNGSIECKDKSDESVDQCASNCCPPFGFQCGYGACIDERDKCNQNKDCADGSDENELLCGRQRRPITSVNVHDASIHSNENKLHTPINTTAVPRPEVILNTNQHTVYCFSYPEFSEKCEINKVPENGWIEFVSPSASQIGMGNLVASFTPVKYNCLPDHVLSGKSSNICFNGEWMNEVPDCVTISVELGSN